MNPRYLFSISKFLFLPIILNLGFYAQALSSHCDINQELEQKKRIPLALVAFLVEDEEEGDDKVIGTGFVINKFGDIAAPKHVILDGGEIRHGAKVQLFRQRSVKLENEYEVLQHSMGNSERDWVILKKKYDRKPKFDNLDNGSEFLSISHNRYVDKVPHDVVAWYVDSVRQNTHALNQASGTWVGPIPGKPGKFEVTMERFGGHSGAVYISNCTGEVHGIFESAESDGSAFFDHTGALMELALDQVVDFDTSQGIFRGESDRRTDRINTAFWKALQAQLDHTDRELNLLSWTAKVRIWNLAGDRGVSDIGLKIGIEYKRIPRPGLDKQHRPKKELLNAWVCVVLDNEIARDTCLRGSDQRLTASNGFVPPDNVGGDYEAVAPLVVSIEEFRSKMMDLVDSYPERRKDFVDEDDGSRNAFRVDKVKGLLIRFEPKYKTFNLLRHYDPKTGYSKNAGGQPGIFSVVYEACIPIVEKHKRVQAEIVVTSHDSVNFVGVMRKDTRPDSTSCIFEKWD